MFNLSHSDVRNFFFDVYKKANAREELTDLEKLSYSIILEHPEYHNILNNKAKYLEHEWYVDGGQTNPFLHLSMHLTIVEQLAIDQPTGIKSLFDKVCAKFTTRHEAEHQLIDCIAEMLWQSGRTQTAPDMSIYMDCINRKLMALLPNEWVSS